MSDVNNNRNEDELWDVISNPTDAPSSDKTAKAPRQPKTEPRFAKKDAAAAPSSRRIDGFFLACMAGVAAVSVAATLALGGMLGGGEPTPGAPVTQNPSAGETVSQAATDLERENALLRAQLEQQKEQIKDLQSDLMRLMGSEEYLATAPSDPEQSNEVLDAQVEAYEIFAQIQEAYADFDREKLEELIPEMDARLAYLNSDALNVYYKILEYVEQPSNG
jgi:predicted lipid-binding transport protein (Tim44 family)